jgi:hypothetical protein
MSPTQEGPTTRICFTADDMLLLSLAALQFLSIAI